MLTCISLLVVNRLVINVGQVYSSFRLGSRNSQLWYMCFVDSASECNSCDVVSASLAGASYDNSAFRCEPGQSLSRKHDLVL